MKCVILLALFAVAFTVPFEDVEKITGGYECPAHSVPYQASLFVGYYVCAGSLISSLWVLSVAHCYHPSFQVHLGKYNFNVNQGTEQVIYSSKVIRHPSYSSSTLNNNIMLIKLSSAATINSYVSPVSLPSSFPSAGTMCMVSGWGTTLSNGTSYPSTLRCLDVTILRDTTYKSAYPGQITSSMFCAGFMKEGKGICQGDSGSPLVCNGHLQGIVSWVHGCVQNNMPDVFVKVYSYVSWITNTMVRN